MKRESKPLVTGGAGFIGSNFVHYALANTDRSVTVLDRLTFACNRASIDGLPADRFQFVQGDIAEAALVDDIFVAHDAVVHYIFVGQGWQRSPRSRVRTVIRGAGDHLELLEQLRPVPTRRRVHSTPDHDVLRGERPRLYGKGENVRDWIHTNDLLSAVLTILERGEIGGTYPIGADGEKKNK